MSSALLFHVKLRQIREPTQKTELCTRVCDALKITPEKEIHELPLRGSSGTYVEGTSSAEKNVTAKTHKKIRRPSGLSTYCKAVEDILAPVLFVFK